MPSLNVIDIIQCQHPPCQEILILATRAYPPWDPFWCFDESGFGRCRGISPATSHRGAFQAVLARPDPCRFLGELRLWCYASLPALHGTASLPPPEARA